MTALKWLLLIAVVGYGGVLGLMYVFQRALMYFPDPTRTPPAAAGLPQAQEVTLSSGDGEKLIAWYVPPKGTKPLIIYFHGNAGALDLRAGRFKWVIEDGTGLLALSYRGYGGSTGKPTETGFISDGMGLAREVARNVLPEGTYVAGRICANLNACSDLSPPRCRRLRCCLRRRTGRSPRRIIRRGQSPWSFRFRRVAA